MASLALAFDILARDKASAVFKHVGDTVEDTGRRTEGFGSKIAGFGTGILKVGGMAAAALGGVAVAGGVMGLKTAASMETARISFETMLGSAEKADSFLKDLSKFAASTPFEFPELQTAASSLISAGVNADKVIPIMRSLGDVTSGMGTGSEGVQRATVALQQMAAAGRITGEDLNQLRDAGVPVFDLLAAATGKSKEEIAKLAQSGKLGKKEMEQLFKALETGKGLERFNGLMEKQSKSLSGVFSTLKDTVNMSLSQLVAPAIPAITSGLNKVSSGIAQFMGGITGNVKIMDQSARPLLELFGLGVRAMFQAFKDGDVTSDGFVGKMEKVGVTLRNVAGFVKDEVIPRIRAFGSFVADEVVPRVVLLGQWINDKVIPPLVALIGHVRDGATAAFTTIKQKFDENREGLSQLGDTFRSIADFIATRVLPILGPAVELAFKIAGESIGRTIDTLARLGQGFSMMWSVAQPVLSALASVFLTVAGTIVNGAAKMLSWMPGLGDKLRAAAADFNAFRDQVNRALNGIRDKVVTLTYVTKGNAPGARSTGGGIVFEKAFASGGRMPAGGPYLVGEDGPEIVWTGQSAYVSNAPETARMLRSTSSAPRMAGGGTVRLHPDDIRALASAVIAGAGAVVGSVGSAAYIGGR